MSYKNTSPAMEKVAAMDDGSLNEVAKGITGEAADYCRNWDAAMAMAEQTKLLKAPNKLTYQDDGTWKVSTNRGETLARDKVGARCITLAIALKHLGIGDYYTETIAK